MVSQLLVAPLLESGSSRTVYLPKGKWIDYQSGKVYEGGGLSGDFHPYGSGGEGLC